MKKAKHKFKRFQDDMDRELAKSKEFQFQFEVETAKLKVAEKLAETREKIGLTQAELAHRMRVSQQLISRIESGSDNITIETLIKFLEILGVTLKIGLEKRKGRHDVLKFA